MRQPRRAIARSGARSAAAGGESASARATAAQHQPAPSVVLQRHRGEILGLIAVVAVGPFAGGLNIVPGQRQGLRLHGRDDPGGAGQPAPERLAGAAAGSSRTWGVATSCTPNRSATPCRRRRASTTPRRPIVGHYRARRCHSPCWSATWNAAACVILYSCDQGACDDATSAPSRRSTGTCPGQPAMRVPEGQHRTSVMAEENSRT